MNEVDEIIENMSEDDLLDPIDDSSEVIDDLEDFITADSDSAENAIFDLEEMPDELRQEIEAIEHSSGEAQFETDFDVDAADGNPNVVIDPTADYIPEDFENIEARYSDHGIVEHGTVIDAQVNLNQDLSPREINGEPTETPSDENDLDGNTEEATEVTADSNEIYGSDEDISEVGIESEEDDIEMPEDKEEIEVMDEDLKDDEIVEETETEEVEDVSDDDVEYDIKSDVEDDVEMEADVDSDDINTEAEQALLVEIQDTFLDCAEEVEVAQAAADEQLSEDSVDAETEEVEDAFANVSEMADVNIDGNEEDEPHFVHEGEEVRPGVTSEAPEEADAVATESVDFTKFVDTAFKNMK